MWKLFSKRPAAKPVSARRMMEAAAMEGLEERRLMTVFTYTVSVDAYATGITAAHDSGTGSLAATVVSIDAPSAPANETILQAALTQASVTLTATHTPTLNGTYSGSGSSASNRLLFLAAEDTGLNYPGTHSHEQSLATAKGLGGRYVVAFEDGTDADYNDGYFLVSIT